MRKLSALVHSLLLASGLQREQATAFADEGSLQITGRDLGLVHEPDGTTRAQIEVGIWRYEGVIQLERYPFDGPTLLAHVLAWLAEHDAERPHQNVNDPSLTIHLNDADTCDVELSVEFEEALVVREAPDGPIVYLGRRWVMALPEITPAQAITAMEGRIDG